MQCDTALHGQTGAEWLKLCFSSFIEPLIRLSFFLFFELFSLSGISSGVPSLALITVTSPASLLEHPQFPFAW